MNDSIPSDTLKRKRCKSTEEEAAAAATDAEAADHLQRFRQQSPDNSNSLDDFASGGVPAKRSLLIRQVTSPNEAEEPKQQPSPAQQESPASPDNPSAASTTIVDHNESPESPPAIEADGADAPLPDAPLPNDSADEGEIDDDGNESDKPEATTNAAPDGADCRIIEAPIALIDLDDIVGDTELPATAISASESPASPVATEEQPPLMSITFRDAATVDRLQAIVQQAVRTALFRHRIIVQTRTPRNQLTLHIHETAHKRLDLDDAAFANSAGQLDNDDDGDGGSQMVFIIDSEPAVRRTDDDGGGGGGVGRNASGPDGADLVPRYLANVSASVYDPVAAAAAAAASVAGANQTAGSRAPRPRAMCFNCGGDHQMRDCREPRNAQRIRESRLQFGAAGGGVRMERYHVDASQRFGHCVPGVVSAELREALGLRPGDLPLHVYRMRVLGYPPGWLESARVSGSGLAMFVDGDDGGGDAEPVVDGGERAAPQDEYDLKKIHEFPGFNVPAAEGTFDVSYNLRLPPMQPHQSRIVMLQQMRARSTKSYKRKSSFRAETTATATDAADDPLTDLTAASMDIDDADADADANADDANPPVPGCESLTADDAAPAAVPPLSAERTSTPICGQRSDSPSLTDLQRHQQQLQAALDDSALSAVNISQQAPDEDGGAGNALAPEADAADREEEEVEAGRAEEASRAQSPLNTSSKHSMSGTPLLASASPYTQLPAGANWSVGVSDIIDFENLADSTGKFERMKGLIRKVRTTVKQLSDEYDG